MPHEQTASAQVAVPQGSSRSSLADAIRDDYRTIVRYQEKYRGAGEVTGRLFADAVRKVGFQIMIAYRLMQWLRAARAPLLPAVLSRLCRHLYAADIHWDAEFEPGVMVVHGMGLCISGRARVGSGAILFQHVTLGEGIDPATRRVGSPTVERDVHIGPGATLIGPITIGEGSKIMAGCVVTESIPPRSLVEAARPVVRPRGSQWPAC